VYRRLSGMLGIFNDQFITQSLLSRRVKILKIGQHVPKLWTIKYRVVFFYETRCITKSLQMSEDTNNPVYKLATDNLAMDNVVTC